MRNVISEDQDVGPQTRSKKDKGIPAAMRNRRDSKKLPLSVSYQPTARAKGEGSRTAAVRGENDVPNTPVQLKPMKKGTTVSHGVVETVFGNLRNSPTAVDELRRKRDADAQQCGRIPKTIGTNPTKTAVDTEELNETVVQEPERRRTSEPAITRTNLERNGKSHHTESGASQCILYGRYCIVLCVSGVLYNA